MEHERLLVMEIDDLLVQRYHSFDPHITASTMKPDTVLLTGENFFIRPFARTFLRFCHLHYKGELLQILSLVAVNLVDRVLFIRSDNATFPLPYDIADEDDNFLSPAEAFCSYFLYVMETQDM